MSAVAVQFRRRTRIQAQDVEVSTGRWSGRTGVAGFDLTTRWSLYLTSASEVATATLLTSSQPHGRSWAVVVVSALALAHTAACLSVLRAGIAHLLGGSPVSRRELGLAAGLTLGGVVAAAAAFPSAGAFTPSSSAGLVALVFCAGMSAAITPLVGGYRLLGVVGLPAAVVGALQLVSADPSGREMWALYYLLWVGTLVVSYRVSLWALSLVWEIDRARDVHARLAVAEERLRFARDLHDVLGRNLAVIALNSELAAQLVHRGRDGAAERMLEVRAIAQESMREVRDVVAGYREADLDAELAGARSLLRSAGISARVIGDGAELPGAVQAALGWVVREATTNIIRHSEPTVAVIELDVVRESPAGDVAVLRIENDGVRADTSAARTGAGLVGVRERLAGLGGTVTAGTVPGGRFVVRVRLPLTVPSTSDTSVAEPVRFSESAESAASLAVPAATPAEPAATRAARAAFRADPAP